MDELKRLEERALRDVRKAYLKQCSDLRVIKRIKRQLGLKMTKEELAVRDDKRRAQTRLRVARWRAKQKA